MIHYTKIQLITQSFLLLLILVGCRGNITSMESYKTDFGKLKFYFQSYTNVDSEYRHLVATIEDSRYDFRPDQIIKQTGEIEGFYYELCYDKALKNKDDFIDLNAMDGLVLSEADLMLDSLRWSEFKRSAGASGFLRREFSYLE
jgi:hypothetical protein